MESSEDDAGAATYASRRASAREKDIGRIEDVNATSSFQQDSSNPRTSCETPAMSEENFDGDSVPSPSTQDVNTSTEAILDMIDEIVDGPGAPKRLPLAPEKDTDSRFAGGGDSDIVLDECKDDTNLLNSLSTSSATSAKIEEEQNCQLSVTNEQISQNEVLVDVKVVCDEVPQTISPVLDSNDSTVSVDTKKDLVSSCEEPNSSSVQNIPSNSVNQTVQSNTDIDIDSAPSERTIKTVTSSDIRDNVIVESAESTSSENSISEGQTPVVEALTRSPLRRRLVRPAPIRPDSTVSSTVDSSININTIEQASDCVVKDVSSSSDAVPPIFGNIQSEETRNESDINVCKAETSTVPAKKIKLIRQKIIPQTSKVHIENTVDPPPIQEEGEQCQSTSSDVAAISLKLHSIPLECTSITNLDSETNCSPGTSITLSPKISEPIEVTTKIAQEIEEIVPPTTSSADVVLPETDVVKKLPPLIINLSADVVLPETDVVKKLPPLIINLSASTTNECTENIQQNENSCNVNTESSESIKQVPKLMIKLGSKHSDDIKPPVPKLTIKSIRPPLELEGSTVEKINDDIPHITKLNIKPVTKQPEKIYEIHRKSSSSEISESEYSENDENTSTSDQASTSDQGVSDVIPKVTIKLGKPGTECEGQFYTEKNIPKLTIKTIQNSEYEHEQLSPTKMKIFLSQNPDKQSEKIPKLTIKTVAKCESQPLSPKLTIKPLKPPDDGGKETSADHSQSQEIPKLKISTEMLSLSSDVKDSTHVPKITIKPVSKPEGEVINKSKKMSNENFEHIPVVTKLNIKPILKPDSGELSETLDKDKVPVVSKLNIKPIVKPKDSELDSSKEVPKIMKLNIKPLKNPDTNSSEEKDCDDINADLDENSIPVITKLNIKPIVKPLDEDKLKDNENQSSETGTSSDEYTDHIPIVTKINIKPICKPNDLEESGPSLKKEDNIPIITKLNIKPLIKPDDTLSPLSPKKELLKSAPCSPKRSPTITKLNIKPIIKPDEPKLVADNENDEATAKNPPLLMKINRKTGDTYLNDDQYSVAEVEDHKVSNSTHESSTVLKVNKPLTKPSDISTKIASDCNESRSNLNDKSISLNDFKIDQPFSQRTESRQNCISQFVATERKQYCPKEDSSVLAIKEMIADSLKKQNLQEVNVNSSAHSTSFEFKETLVNDTDRDVYNVNITDSKLDSVSNVLMKLPTDKGKSLHSRQNCTLLKKLLETRKDKLQDEDGSKKQNKHSPPISHESQKSTKNVNSKNDFHKEKAYSEMKSNMSERSQDDYNKSNDIGCSITPLRVRSMQELCLEANENLSRPLEISISDKVSCHSPDQDSPRIILKINKTEQGASAKIITEEIKKSEQKSCSPENTQILANDLLQKKKLANCRRKPHIDTPMPMGKRLRSSRVLQTSDKTSTPKKNMSKRPSAMETSPPQVKEQELSVLDSKRLKLGQLLSSKSLTITPIVSKACSISPTKATEIKQGAKNHSLLNNENCAKNGSSKLHNILSNLQVKQLQAMPFSDLNHSENNQSSSPDLKSSTSTGSLELISENSVMEKTRPEVHELLFHDNSESHDFSIGSEEIARDPLEVDSLKLSNEIFLHENIPKSIEMTPTPKKRGRPRKLPVSEGARVVTLPVTALEERPQRSLRLSRDRPVILVKPRGRGRGRGRRLDTDTEQTSAEPVVDTANKFFIEQKPEDIDPTSSRIKLPRMTEALDNMPGGTPLSSRRRTSSDSFTGLDSSLPKMEDPFLKSPELVEMRGRGTRGGRGSRGGRGRAATRSPRGRGRGRGGGRGAMYMKETMGIYGRVCGPATTTVQLFEEETCMMDDNATPAKSSHLLDEDSQSSVKSLTNDSSRMRKSKFADLFDSNKVWTAADVKEYIWPPPDNTDGEHQVMMIQEQVAMFLGVKSFKRRYPELKRRTIVGEERDYVLSKGLVTEALCDLGITAVDASEVLDIMLSDYPHKYEDFRSHQREKQLAEPSEEVDDKTELKEKVEIKETKPETKPEPPKVDPEKTRQDQAAAAIASASEFNARMNAMRRPACADLQSLSVCRRRPPPPPPVLRVRPPAGFYPHALLPGQYQHWYRVYTPEELRYFPLNTSLAAPPAASSDSSSESDAEWGSRCSSSDHSDEAPASAKRKKLTKTKRISHTETTIAPKEEEVDTCRACKMRIEANRKYTHERFLVCANCNAKLHPSCVELGPDTIRKCREYAWQCAECKTCCACTRPADDDKMLFCDLCDRGFHIYCVGLHTVPNGRWHCVECSVCRSCGSRQAGGAGAQWQHQTRRGPGGHKLYSHSLCEPCARAYRIGRYCPLCDRSFIGPKGTMQLVICKLCDRQLHQECVRATAARLKVLDYTCAECRRGGITSRAAAVRLAPRTIATLFMAKRRFNKYAHRQYLQSRARPPDPPV